MTITPPQRTKAARPCCGASSRAAPSRRPGRRVWPTWPGDRRLFARPDRRRQGIPQGGRARPQAGRRQCRHPRPAVARGGPGLVRARGHASHRPQLSTRGKKAKIVLATQMISSIGNIVVRKDLFDAGIDSVEKLAAYKRPNGGKPVIAATAIGSGTWMYGTYTFESKGLGNNVTWAVRRPQHHAPGARDQTVRRHHGGAGLGHRG